MRRLLAVTVTAVALTASSVLPAAAQPAAAAPAPGTVQWTGSRPVAPGVTLRSFTVTVATGSTQGWVVHVDLRRPGARLDLLHPDEVAEPATVSAMADAQHAVAGTNGDFFNNTDEHPGVAATFSSSGAEIAAGHDLKGAVPDAQRFGPALVAGTTGDSVFGVGVDGRARLAAVDLRGFAAGVTGVFPVAGLNQYALPDGAIGAFTHDWGDAPRVRATCGSDTDRGAPCSTDTAEVTVRRGIITDVHRGTGAGPIPVGTTVLVGRDVGADRLATLRRGQPLALAYHLVTRSGLPLRFAVGAEPILRGGAPLPGLDAKDEEPRTAVGVSDGGRGVDLVVLDGRRKDSAGASFAEEAALLRTFGDTEGANLDGGGSSDIVTADPGARHVTVRNVPSDGHERPVANGIGVFVR